MGKKWQAVKDFSHGSDAGQLDGVAGKTYDEREFGDQLEQAVAAGIIVPAGGPDPVVEPVTETPFDAVQTEQQPAADHREGQQKAVEAGELDGQGADADADAEPFKGAADMNAGDYVTAAIVEAESLDGDEMKASLQAALDYEKRDGGKNRASVIGPLEEEIASL